MHPTTYYALLWYADAKAAFESKTQNTAFPDFLTWLLLMARKEVA